MADKTAYRDTVPTANIIETSARNSNGGKLFSFSQYNDQYQLDNKDDFRPQMCKP